MNIAILLAGGSGLRMGGDCPKQFLQLDGEFMFLRSLRTFVTHPQIDKVFLVCELDHINIAKEAISRSGLVASVIGGGETRQDSSYIGLCFVKQLYGEDNIVLLHDSARPFVSPEIISANIEAATEYGACTTVIPAHDTMLISDNGDFAVSVPNRSTLYSVQTPQSFKLSLLVQAHSQIPHTLEVTDDAGVVISAGIPVKLIAGSKQNFKITTKEDMIFAKALL